MSLSRQILHFYTHLNPPSRLPNQIQWLHPQREKEVREAMQQFLEKFYQDDQPRKLLFGINPGRHGAGITGINFTGPKQLAEDCGITHPFKNQSELSAGFIYEMITAYGGVHKFYSRNLIGSVCPLGFVQDSKNLNYYDDAKLLHKVTPFITGCIEQQVQWTSEKATCICIGGEKNFKFLSSLNKHHQWFDKIIPLPHPRFIMQYRRKEKERYISQYLAALGRGA